MENIGQKDSEIQKHYRSSILLLGIIMTAQVLNCKINIDYNSSSVIEIFAECIDHTCNFGYLILKDLSGEG